MTNDGIVEINGRDFVLGHDGCSLVVEVDHTSITNRVTHGCRCQGKEQLGLRLLGDQLLGDVFKLCCIDIRQACLPRN